MARSTELFRGLGTGDGEVGVRGLGRVPLQVILGLVRLDSAQYRHAG
jgi:hypothetical protein